MNRRMVRSLGIVVLLGGLFVSAAPVSGQENRRIADYYGIGADGTIGRGTTILPGGPSEHFGSSITDAGLLPSVTYYRSGYAGYSVPSSPRSAVAPYWTNRYYTPGDGYRYPLYYSPITRSYFYYPVRR